MRGSLRLSASSLSMWLRVVCVSIVGAVVVFAAACGSEPKATEEKRGCSLVGGATAAIVPVGKSAYCSCSDGSPGEFTCQEDLRFTTCGPCTLTAKCNVAGRSKPLEEGEPIDCQCSPGVSGTRYCQADGTLNPCQCNGSETDGGGTPEGGLPPLKDCGNGMPDPGERCDDGNDVNNDACSNQCTVNVNAPGYGACGNEMVVFASKGEDFFLRGLSTRPYGRTHASPVGCKPGTYSGVPSKDRVLKIVPSDTGDIFFTTANADFPHWLDVRTSCDKVDSGVACSDAVTTNGSESVGIMLKKAVPLYLWIDGENNTEGKLDLRIQFR
jgi:cysteine-rich repeat protein